MKRLPTPLFLLLAGCASLFAGVVGHHVALGTKAKPAVTVVEPSVLSLMPTTNAVELKSMALAATLPLPPVGIQTNRLAWGPGADWQNNVVVIIDQSPDLQNWQIGVVSVPGNNFQCEVVTTNMPTAFWRAWAANALADTQPAASALRHVIFGD